MFDWLLISEESGEIYEASSTTDDEKQLQDCVGPQYLVLGRL